MNSPFLQLTNLDGTKFVVGVAQIRTFNAFGTGTKIYFDGAVLQVQESYASIVAAFGVAIITPGS